MPVDRKMSKLTSLTSPFKPQIPSPFIKLATGIIFGFLCVILGSLAGLLVS